MKKLHVRSAARRRLVLAFGAGTAAAVLPARAAAYPQRTITLVVPFAAGGPTDIVGRIVAQALSARLGQQVIVENRAGAAGVVGAAHVARSQPDGYTLGVVTVSTHGTIPNLTAKPSYDPVRDFAPISNLAASVMCLSVHPSVPAHTLEDFIALVRARPGELAYGNAGAGGIGDLGMTWLMQITGGRMVSVPYKGSAPALADLVSGQVQAAFDNFPSSLPFIRSGQIRPLAVTGRSRQPTAAQIPTFGELGHPDFQVQAWYGLVGPAGLPASVVERLAGAVGETLDQPAWRERLEAAGAQPGANAPAEFAAQIAQEVERWRRVITAAGIRPQ